MDVFNQQNLEITQRLSPQANMVSNINNNDGIDQQIEEDKRKKQKEKKLDKDIKAVKKELEKQQARLSELLSNGFQLANYYFVFQGVILTTLCNRNTILKCSDRWFLATLSALAATVNLFALVSIGRKYIRIFSEHAKIWSKCNDLQVEKEKQTENSNSNTPNDPQSSSSSSLQTIPISNTPNDLQSSSSSSSSSGHGDDYGTKERWVYFGICIIFFLSFAIIVFVGCLTFLCRDRAEPKK